MADIENVNYDPYEGSGVGYYRCNLCGTPNAPWDIEKHGGCRKCGHKRIFTTNLSFFEKVGQVFRFPWRFTCQFWYFIRDHVKAAYYYIKSRL